MHKVFIFTFVIAVSLSAIGAQAESYKRTLREYVEGSVLMLVIITEEETNLEKKDKTLFDGIISEKAKRLAETADAEVVSYIVFPAEGGGKLYIHMHSDTLTTVQIIKRLSAEPDVINVRPNYINRLDTM